MGNVRKETIKNKIVLRNKRKGILGKVTIEMANKSSELEGKIDIVTENKLVNR